MSGCDASPPPWRRLHPPVAPPANVVPSHPTRLKPPSLLDAVSITHSPPTSRRVWSTQVYTSVQASRPCEYVVADYILIRKVYIVDGCGRRYIFFYSFLKIWKTLPTAPRRPSSPSSSPRNASAPPRRVHPCEYV